MAFETINLGTQPAGTGGDTARSSFEKVNRNFLAVDVLSAAMSQAQFEAIRSQNNEEFAASGFVHFGKHRNNISAPIAGAPVNEGLWVYPQAGSENSFSLGIVDGITYTEGKSKTQQPVINIAGVVTELSQVNTSAVKQNRILLPKAPDGKTTYNKSTGVITNHATVAAAFNAQAADPTNVEVVTDRVDMWGFESWLEEVNTTNPYVYPNGLIQSQATTMDGIATSASARPVTYCAVFDGDTGSKGKGLNFFALTDANKKKVLSNPKNNLYYLDDGRLVQRRLRQRTIAGAGNGDWNNLPVAHSSALSFLSGSLSFIRLQGNRDIAEGFGGDNGRLAYGTSLTQHPDYNKNGFGVTGAKSLTLSATGECYFLVCGTVNRLNQGLYHPSYNPLGAAKAAGDTFWYNTAASITSKADCFDATKLLANSGSIASGKSGRPDGRFYDAIYADGQGGVCRDMRYSAYGVDAVYFAEADQKVKNGTYRGFERLKFTTPYVGYIGGNTVANGWGINFTAGASTAKLFLNASPSSWYLLFKGGDIIGVTYAGKSLALKIVNHTSVTVMDCEVISNTGMQTLLSNYDYSLAVMIKTNDFISSVGGSFLQTDVIGNPANILATPQLANGWQGSWIPVIPDGTSKEWPITRKSLSSTTTRFITDDNGVTWTASSTAIDAIKNTIPTEVKPSSRVALIPYQAFAKQTENAVNAAVYGGLNGLGDVAVYAGFGTAVWGAIFCEGLIGKIGVSGTSGTGLSHVSLIEKNIRPDTFLISGTSADYCSHSPITKPAPNIISPAVKALGYVANINQQAIPHFAYAELRHNGTSWGDDGKVPAVSNQSTKTDLNGNTVLVGTAKLKEPIGWIKNKV